MADMTPTNNAVLIPEIWSAKTFDTIYQKNKARMMVAFESVPEGADIVHFPAFGNFTAAQITPGTAMTAAAITPTQIDLTIDQWWGVAFTINKQLRKQVQRDINLVNKYTERMGLALAYKIETLFLGLYASMSQATTGAADLTDAIILAAIQKLDEAGAPEDGRSMIIKPSQKTALMKIDKFTLANQSGTDIIQTGKFGKIYNVDVYVSNNVISNSSFYNNLLMHRDYALFGMQSEVEVESEYSVLQKGEIVTGDTLFGYVETRDTFGVRMPTSN